MDSNTVKHLKQQQVEQTRDMLAWQKSASGSLCDIARLPALELELMVDIFHAFKHTRLKNGLKHASTATWPKLMLPAALLHYLQKISILIGH